jgi:hypothetical protein
MNIQRKLKIIILALMVLSTSACSSDPMDVYVGYWLSQTPYGALEISGGGGEYEIQFIKTNKVSPSSKKTDLIVSKDKLFFQAGRMGSQEIEIIHGGLTLRYRGNLWQRSTLSKINKIRKANNLDKF